MALLSPARCFTWIKLSTGINQDPSACLDLTEDKEGETKSNEYS